MFENTNKNVGAQHCLKMKEQVGFYCNCRKDKYAGQAFFFDYVKSAILDLPDNDITCQM